MGAGGTGVCFMMFPVFMMCNGGIVVGGISHREPVSLLAHAVRITSSERDLIIFTCQI